MNDKQTAQMTQGMADKIWAMLPREVLLGAIIGYMTAAAGFVPNMTTLGQQQQQQQKIQPEQPAPPTIQQPIIQPPIIQPEEAEADERS